MASKQTLAPRREGRRPHLGVHSYEQTDPKDSLLDSCSADGGRWTADVFKERGKSKIRRTGGEAYFILNEALTVTVMSFCLVMVL